MKKQNRHRFTHNKHLLLTAGVVASALLTGCNSTYKPVKQVPVRDLVEIIADSANNRTVYLDRNSVSGSLLDANWRHATIITSYNDITEEPSQHIGASAATEVTFDCQNQTLRYDLIRSYPEPKAQGVTFVTATYDSYFDQIKNDDAQGMAIFNAVCADFTPADEKQE